MHLLVLAEPSTPKPSKLYVLLGQVCWNHEAGEPETLQQHAGQLAGGQSLTRSGSTHNCSALRALIGARQCLTCCSDNWAGKREPARTYPTCPGRQASVTLSSLPHIAEALHGL